MLQVNTKLWKIFFVSFCVIQSCCFIAANKRHDKISFLYPLYRLQLGGTVGVTIAGISTAGVMHTDGSGNLSTSTVVNADVDPAAGIVDSKLATISTSGKVNNSATTATNANTASAIVARDSSGNFSAGTITANLTGNVTGSASLNVLKAGDTMTGALTIPAGTAAAPTINFTGSTTTGLSAQVANVLLLSTAGTGRLTIDANGNTTYSTNYKAHAYRSSTQAINTTTATIAFNATVIDPNSNFNTTTGVYTAPMTGNYLVTADVTATSTTAGDRTLAVVKNGTAVTGYSTTGNISPALLATASLALHVSGLIALTANDLLRVDYTTGASDTVQPNTTHITIHFMST